MKHFLIILSSIFLLNSYIYAQVPANVPTDGLVGYWPFNGNANDESGSGYNGSVNYPILSPNRFGDINMAYYFDGVNDTINVTHNGDLTFSAEDDFSISLWFNCENLDHTRDLIVHKFTFYNGFAIGIFGHSSGGKVYVDLEGDTNGVNCRLFSIDSVRLNKWYNLTFIYNGTENFTELYLNGILQENVAIPGELIGLIGKDNIPISFGKRVGETSPSHFYGTLDDIGIWNRALTSEEIYEVYYNTSPEDCSGITSFGKDTISNDNFVKETGKTLDYAALKRSGRKLRLATIYTSAITDITQTTATCGGNITDEGCSEIVQRGIVWSTSSNPTIELNEGIYYNGSGDGTFISYLSGLSFGTTYYVRAFAKNSVGVNYGDEKSFTTDCLIPDSPAEGTHSVSETQITWNWDSAPDATGYKWNTVNDYSTAVDVGTNLSYNETGLTCNASYTRYVWSYNDCAYSTVSSISSSTNACPFSCGDSFVDSRDGNVYTTVQINGQCWMAENLKYLPSVVGPLTYSYTTPYYYVYDYSGTNVSTAKATTNYNTYGVLYNWPAARISCPTGWHLPSDTEWTSLSDYLGGQDVAGGKLKELGTTHWGSPNVGATNEVGFTALPGGRRGFDRMGSYGYWWTDTEYNTNVAYDRNIVSNRANIYKVQWDKYMGFSVRCVKD